MFIQRSDSERRQIAIILTKYSNANVMQCDMYINRIYPLAVHGNFSLWSEWSSCQRLNNKTWIQKRTRECQRINGGMNCEGVTEDYTTKDCAKGEVF